ncbi:cytochrome c biogenesis protein ResB [Rothia sp. P7181]|uniref:cytochrome c biogenesis protein ResB n=1 Tax=Rothia sp. P7181 TaxID=3402663 RepID=UPI003AED80E5
MGEQTTSQAPALGVWGMTKWAWTQLTKMNTALILLLLLAVAAVPGSLFPQRIQDPVKVNDYIENHPTWGPIADKIQLFDVFSSAWFSAIYLLLFISLIGCVLPRAKKHYQMWRKPPVRTPKNLARLPIHRTLEIPASLEELSAQEAIDDAARILSRRGYRVETHVEDQGRYSVAAERGYLREVGNILFHLSMIGILIGIAIGSLLGYRGQKILVEGDTFVNSLISYDSFTPGTNYNPDWLTPYSLTLENFEVQYDRQRESASYGSDIGYEATFKVNDHSGEQRNETLKVNEPLSIDGNSINLAGNGYAPVIKVTNPDGTIAFEGPVVGLTTDPKYNSSIVLKVPDAHPDQLGFVGMFLPTGGYNSAGVPVSLDAGPYNPTLVLQSYYGDLGLDEGVPQNVYILDTSKLTEMNSMAQQNGIILTATHTEENLPDGRGKISFEGYKRYIGVDIHYDPGKGIVFWSFVLAFTGLIISLFVPRRRVWVRAYRDGQNLTVEYALLARGEDPRLLPEADKLTEAFARCWELEFSEAEDTEA